MNIPKLLRSRLRAGSRTEVVERVLREVPFSSRLKIVRLKPMGARYTVSGQAFWAIAEDGRRFKLRVCRDEPHARMIEANLERFPHLFPPFVGRDGRFILMEALHGYRMLTLRGFLRNLGQVGRLCGEVHEVDGGAEHDHRAYFRERFERLTRSGLLGDELVRRVDLWYRESVEHLDLRVTLDVADIHERNFMSDREGRLLFVDEDGVAPRIRGQGLAKLLKLVRRDDQWQLFLAGYNDVSDGSYLTPEYCRHLLVVDTVRSLDWKFRGGASRRRLAKELARLERYAGSA